MLTLLASCGGDSREVSFREEVYPVLQANCLECHRAPDGAGYQKSGLSMESYHTLMKGTRFGPVVVPGNSLTSALNMVIEGRVHPSLRMPHGNMPSLSKEQIEIIKKWVDQGAKNN
jgi:hypothetical protein